MSDARSPPNEEEPTKAGSRSPSDSDSSEGRFLDERVRNATLQAQVTRLEEQRESLRERVSDLEAQVESLEAERAMLETTLENERERRQQVIETYERILDGREGHCRDDGTETRTFRVLRKIRSIPSRHL